jgi:hypothetical protein
MDNGKKADFGGDKERSIGDMKDTIEVDKYLIGEKQETQEAIGKAKDLIDNTKDSIGKKKDSIGETGNLFWATKDSNSTSSMEEQRREGERKVIAEFFRKYFANSNQKSKMLTAEEINMEQSASRDGGT